MRFFVAVVAVVLGVGCASLRGSRSDENAKLPVTVLVNAKVFTADPAAPWAQALAYQGDRLVAVGDLEAVRAIARSRSVQLREFDAGGRTIVPGLNDAHFHGGAMPPMVRVRTAGDGMEPTLDAVLAALQSAVAAQPEGAWLDVTVGATVLDDPRATRATLDGVSARHAISLSAWSGHGKVLNSRALARVGFDDAVQAPLGGAMRRDAAGKLDGRLDEYAGYLAWRRLALEVPAAERAKSYANDAQAFLRSGVTSVQDFSLAYPPAEALAALAQARPALRWRVIRMPMTGPGALDPEAERLEDPPAVPNVRVAGVKWVLDGTPVERGAAMSAPYADRPETRGTLNFPADAVVTLLRAAQASGDQPMFHAVGDAAIQAVLDGMEATGGAATWAARRVRLEHGDMVRPDQVARAKALGVVLVQNPSHTTIRPMMHARYAGRRGMQPMKSLLQAGLPLALGSDGPMNPFLNVMFATTHAVSPEEALTREEAISAYTLGAAYAEGLEAEKGSLTAGKLADFAVLSQDVFTVSAKDLPATQSVLTVVGGNIAHNLGVIPLSQ